MEIHRLDPADQRQARRYVEFPFRLYRDHPLWVPPFVREVCAVFSRRHPFYEHAEAAFFLAQAGAEVAGRIAVLDNARHNTHHGSRTAFFYHFDAVEDRAVSRALLSAACDWARGRGLERMWGPKGFLHTDGQGILVEGFQHHPAMGIAYNYPYYGELLQDTGFEKSLDLISWYMDREFQFPERFLEVADRVKRRRGFQSTTFRTKAELGSLIPKVALVYNESFVEVQGYTPITEAEARAIGDRILTIADPGLISLLRRGEELVGFVLAYPDVSAALRRCRGRMWPTGWYHLLREFKRTRWINFNGAAILPPFRGLGGNALLYAELYRILIHHPQYDFADLVQIQETNTRMMRELQMVGVTPYKRHRVYQRSLT
jgi:GNAT superfamily N-acetyltransferase